MIEVKPFKADDMLYVIEHGVLEIGLKAQPTEEIRQAAQEREESGQCVTGWVNGEIIGIGGIDEEWKGVGNIWLMLTPKIYEYLKEGYKCIRQGMKKLIDDGNYHRVESYGRVDFPACHILFKHLGFDVEGIARKKTHDKVDCLMYAKVT